MVKRFLLFAALLVSVFMCGCLETPAAVNSENLELVGEISIPEGYDLIEASAYGQFDNNEVFYISDKATGRVYEYDGGSIGPEILIPSGYRLVAVSAYGKFDNKRTFYCQNTATGQIHKFKIK